MLRMKSVPESMRAQGHWPRDCLHQHVENILAGSWGCGECAFCFDPACFVWGMQPEKRKQALVFSLQAGSPTDLSF